MRRFAVLVTVLVLMGPTTGMAQSADGSTLADIRQELTILNVEIQKLRRELSTTGTASVDVGQGSTLERLNTIEAELQRVTAKTEQLEFRVGRVIEDGTNRIGDLEFRLVELEGGDLGALGDTPVLGGDTGDNSTTLPGPVTTPPQNEAQLATQEQADFTRASEALASGDFRSAADQFAAFNQTYPGGPLAAAAELGRGKALEALGDTREAARAYLASFSADQTGQTAPDALLLLGVSLGRLGKSGEACVTLGEVPVRFGETEAATRAQTEMSALGCS
ncbi:MULTISPECIES: tol-pal system protein YbgF [Roseobacteraceae]|jgi:tol-pal system protein YbgF|uniref:Cell division coordinator CpoB n=1 Tax=Pseudosulfitobacter pseudonitzschiae TaxID=1402135 RepID=A0A221K1X2_9RHOB|nr:MULTISPECIES: tol-pal system protein YbgF [Roseobacteraceae]ASM72998.1 tol_pal_ybgF: tol-pal system protein YbgF [Pseudosulfitobacter pseudonitzschiae]